MNSISRFLPAFIIVPVCAYLVMAAIPPADKAGKAKLHEFAKLPVMEEGRTKPIDSVARVDLMLLSKVQTFKDGDKKGEPAIRWFLDSIADKANKYEVFRIEDPQLLDILGLEARPQWFRYSASEIEPKIPELGKLFKQAQELKPSDRDPFNRNVLTLAKNYVLFRQMRTEFSPPNLLMIPPVPGGTEWRSIREAVEEMQQGKEPDAATDAYRKMISAYIQGDAKEFNAALASYQTYMNQTYPDIMRKAAFEVFYNDYAPFYQCSLLYLAMFILAILSWVAYTNELNRIVFWLGICTLVFHTFAIVARMYLQGRPPITNLYSTAIFIGWGCVLMSLLIEGTYKNGIGNLVASVAGSLTTLIAHNLATDGDTMPALRAVLDTNFWLATHVTMINFGYAATFVAGLLSILFVLVGLFTSRLDRDLFQSLTQVIYGSVCFATLLSFTGTVLGGLWADYSWGRFWGWDPKENGALLIVLWNALILHARWGGMVKQRGMAVLAIFGNIVTAWSWFGVNMLGIGLHSYGFMEGAAFWLAAFVASQLMLIVLGCIPLKYWHSYGSVPPAKAAVA
jgi:ABC-type transport system involved in cytochrome c biogenesis permease subunit